MRHIHARMYVHNKDDSLSTHPLASRSCFILPLSYDSTLLFTYLEILLLLLVVQIPIHSCPWFAINCSPLAASPTPRYPVDQVTYLHRWHQQHQPSCLTPFWPWGNSKIQTIVSLGQKVSHGDGQNVKALLEYVNAIAHVASTFDKVLFRCSGYKLTVKTLTS